eukprot:scaffold13196_cov117-Isochrysis_galbana.AAC.4
MRAKERQGYSTAIDDQILEAAGIRGTGAGNVSAPPWDASPIGAWASNGRGEEYYAAGEPGAGERCPAGRQTGGSRAGAAALVHAAHSVHGRRKRGAWFAVYALLVRRFFSAPCASELAGWAGPAVAALRPVAAPPAAGSASRRAATFCSRFLSWTTESHFSNQHWWHTPALPVAMPQRPHVSAAAAGAALAGLGAAREGRERVPLAAEAAAPVEPLARPSFLGMAAAGLACAPAHSKK